MPEFNYQILFSLQFLQISPDQLNLPGFRSKRLYFQIKLESIHCSMARLRINGALMEAWDMKILFK